MTAASSPSRRPRQDCRTTAYPELPRALIERLTVTRPPGGLRLHLSSVTNPCAYLRAAVVMFLSDSAHRCAGPVSHKDFLCVRKLGPPGATVRAGSPSTHTIEARRRLITSTPRRVAKTPV